MGKEQCCRDWLNEVLIWHIPGAALEAVIIILAFLNLFVPIPCATVLLVQFQSPGFVAFNIVFYTSVSVSLIKY